MPGDRALGPVLPQPSDGGTAQRLRWPRFIRDAFRSMQGQPPGENIFEAMVDMLSKQFRVLRLDELLVTRIPEAISVINLFASYGPAA